MLSIKAIFERYIELCEKTKTELHDYVRGVKMKPGKFPQPEDLKEQEELKSTLMTNAESLEEDQLIILTGGNDADLATRASEVLLRRKSS